MSSLQICLSSIGRVAVLPTVLLLAACGGTESTTTSNRQGVFLDSAVEGLGYSTPTQSGATDSNGMFSYTAGERVQFSLGELALPDARAAAIVTPLDLFGTDDPSDARVADLARLLQSLDIDRDASNGIRLVPEVSAIAADTVLDFGGDLFEQQANDVLRVAAVSTPLFDRASATAHLSQTLQDNGLLNSGCSSDHPYVGRTAEFSTLAHGVSGTLSILDDCTLEVTMFNYDGLGPSVSFYTGVNQQYLGVGSFFLGPQLNGQAWVNDTIRLTIPDGKSLDDFDSLSVWCFDFNANFGDAFFGDT